jgi:hypothetical protein
VLIPDLSLDRKWSPEFAELRRTVENEDIAAMPAWFMTSFLIAFFRMESAGDIRLNKEGHTASFYRLVIWVPLSGVCHYFEAEIPRALCLPKSKVSLFFPPPPIVSILPDYS